MNFTLRTKLLLAFTTILVLMVLMGAIIFAQLFAISQIAQDSYVHGQASIKLTGDAIADTLRVRDEFILLTNATQQEDRLRRLDKINEHSAQVIASIERYEPLLESEGARAAVNDFYGAWSDYTVASSHVVQTAMAGKSAEARLAFTGEVEPELENVINLLLLIQDIEDNQHRVEFFEGQTIFQRAAVIAIGVTGLAIVLGFGLALWLSRNIAVPMSNMAQTAQNMAQGDLNQTLPAKTLSRSDEVGVLAHAFAAMTGQLRDLVDSLEHRIADRTQRLEIVAILSERLNSILDFDKLLQELVDQVKDSFNYYHAHVYIVDDAGQNLVLAAGAGQAGAAMKAAGHSIPMNAPVSLVARVARTRNTVTVDNVREAQDWLPNPLLPDTYAEMAVPIVLEGRVVGVLDVQEDRIAGLDEGDANLLRSLANQVAVAIRNARQFTEVETALTNARAVQERYIVEAWDQSKISYQNAEYSFQGSSMLDDVTLNRLEQEAKHINQPALVQIDSNGLTEDIQTDPDSEIQNPKSKIQNQTALVAPIKLQDQIIGTLQFQEEGQQWSEQDLALVRAITDQIAQTADSMRLFEETREQAGREATIREITDKLRAAPNMEQLIAIATKEIAGQLSATHAKLELGVKTQQHPATNGSNGYGEGE